MRVFSMQFQLQVTLNLQVGISFSKCNQLSYVRFATIPTFCQTNACSFTENVKFIVLPYHQVIIDLNLSELGNSQEI